VGAPVGPTGCNAPKKNAADDKGPRGIQVSAGYGRFWSHLHFEGGIEPTLRQQTAVAQAAYFFGNGLDLSLGGGVVANGKMYGDGLSLAVGTGFVVSLRLTWQFLKEKGARPFMSAAVAASYSRSPFEDDAGTEGYLWGTDFRFALTVGYTLFDFWRVYLSPRVFGGPVFIAYPKESIQGRDRYFVQAGMGMSFILPRGFTIYVDGSPAGEWAISCGLAYFIPVE